MDPNDGVRTRLTHSHEVANLARSIGTSVFNRKRELFKDADLHDVVQPILSTIGLAHDLGNPPFGHQGEVAIGRWFKRNEGWIFTHTKKGGSQLSEPLPTPLHSEFINFDGNPQSLRLLAKLQTSVANAGLDLTAATLAASLKYPVAAANVDKKDPIRKKIGYFESESALVAWVREKTGLKEGQRHPLTWIMEACDDIAYSVLDIDDAMKKGVISAEDVVAHLSRDAEVKDLPVMKQIAVSFEKTSLSDARAEIARDIKIGYIRAHLISALISEATENYILECESIFGYSCKTPIMENSRLWSALKDVTRQYAFSHPNVLRMEADGSAAITDLLDIFWCAISDREAANDILSKRLSPISKYAYSLMSQNYLEAANRAQKSSGNAAMLRYRELRLLTDMISGMTDAFTLRIRDDLRVLK